MTYKRNHKFLLFISALVGIVTGFIGTFFQIFIKEIYAWKLGVLDSLSSSTFMQYLFIIPLTIAFIILAAWGTRKFNQTAAGSGIPEVEGEMSDRRSINWKTLLPVKFIGGILAQTSGLVVGREGPTVHMGSAVGKMFSNLCKLDEEFKNTMLASGAGAGLAAAFNAPIAGILFVIEEMRSSFKFSIFAKQCVIIATICAVIVLRLFLGVKPDITMTYFEWPPTTSLWIFVIFGACFGVMGFIFNKCLVFVLNYMADLKPSIFWSGVTVFSIFIAICTIQFPDIIGGGYDVIPQTLKYSIPGGMLIIIFLIRLCTTWVSYGVGTPGGIFAPMLALGTTFGVMFGYYSNSFTGLDLHPGIFAVAGMGALFSATVGAPLTGIILVVELTFNFALLLPMIVTCFSAMVVSYALGNKHIYEVLLERKIEIEKRRSEEKEEKALLKK